VDNLLGHLPYLAGKPKGDKSMVGKRLNAKGCNVKCRKSCVHELPKGREVKPGLVEP